MKNIEEIQNEVAKELYNNTFKELMDRFTNSRPLVPLDFMQEVCKRYAIEVAKATLEKASENAKLEYDDNGYPEFMSVDWLKNVIEAWSLKVNKQSITDEKNIVL